MSICICSFACFRSIGGEYLEDVIFNVCWTSSVLLRELLNSFLLNDFFSKVDVGIKICEEVDEEFCCGVASRFPIVNFFFSCINISPLHRSYVPTPGVPFEGSLFLRLLLSTGEEFSRHQGCTIRGEPIGDKVEGGK